MKFNKILLIAPVCLIFVGCAQPPTRKPLTEANRLTIQNEKLALNSDQLQINADLGLESQMPKTLAPATPPAYNDDAAVDHSSILSVLISAAIVSSIDHSRGAKISKQIRPIRAELQHFNYMIALKKELRRQFKHVKWMKIDSSLASVGYTDQQKQMLLETSKDNTGLFIDMNYEMNKDFTALYVSAHVSMAQPGGADGKLNQIYNNYFVYIDRLPANIKHREAALPIWTADHGKMLKDGLLEGGNVLGKMIAMDIKNPMANLYKLMPGAAVKFKDEQDIKLKGKVVSKIGPMTVFRTPDGTLYAA